jgi:uncharacterized membrane protein
MDQFFDGLTVRLAALAVLVGVAAYVLLAVAWRTRQQRKKLCFQITPRHTPGLRGLS